MAQYKPKRGGSKKWTSLEYALLVGIIILGLFMVWFFFYKKPSRDMFISQEIAALQSLSTPRESTEAAITSINNDRDTAVRVLGRIYDDKELYTLYTRTFHSPSTYATYGNPVLRLIHRISLDRGPPVPSPEFTELFRTAVGQQ